MHTLFLERRHLALQARDGLAQRLDAHLFGLSICPGLLQLLQRLTVARLGFRQDLELLLVPQRGLRETLLFLALLGLQSANVRLLDADFRQKRGVLLPLLPVRPLQSSQGLFLRSQLSAQGTLSFLHSVPERPHLFLKARQIRLRFFAVDILLQTEA